MAGPTRFGIVDMGTNAIRMMIAEANGPSCAVLESHRLPLRLGRDVFNTGQIPEPTMAAIVDSCRRFRASCDRLGVVHIRAIATAAVREARNRELLIDRVREATSIELEVISGTQEAYLLNRAVQTRIDLRRGRSLLVDVGGGSVEVVLVEQGQVVSADSYRLGALRLLAALADSSATGETFLELLQRHMQSLEKRILERFGNGRIDRYAAVGGSIESLGDLLAARNPVPRSGDIDSLPIAAVRSEVEALARLSYNERIELRGLRPDRADTIVPAGIVYVRLAEIAGVDSVLVPKVGIKEGLLQEVVEGHVDSFAAEDHVDVVLSSCRALGRKYHFEAEHAETVLELSRQLFDATREMHALGPRARVLLEAAALLHDIGVAVNNDGHHKHSHYLIAASELVGLSDEERQLVALLARYHRKAAPSREHEDFASLRRKDRALVERLAAILRVADALDRQHTGAIRAVQVKIDEDCVQIRPILSAQPTSSLTLERRAVDEKGQLFAQVFGRPLRLLAP